MGKDAFFMLDGTCWEAVALAHFKNIEIHQNPFPSWSATCVTRSYSLNQLSKTFKITTAWRPNNNNFSSLQTENSVPKSYLKHWAQKRKYTYLSSVVSSKLIFWLFSYFLVKMYTYKPKTYIHNKLQNWLNDITS